jgi:hypothetical protein
MLKRFKFAVLAATATLTLATQGALAACDAPATDLPTRSPGNAAGGAAGFAGVWEGDWPILVHGHPQALCAKLYVSVIGPRSAAVAHCIGSVKEAGLKPQCSKYDAGIDGNELSFTDRGGNHVTFTLEDVGGMLAESENGAHKSSTQFAKAQ